MNSRLAPTLALAFAAFARRVYPERLLDAGIAAAGNHE
jgi:hypothetical protein